MEGLITPSMNEAKFVRPIYDNLADDREPLSVWMKASNQAMFWVCSVFVESEQAKM